MSLRCTNSDGSIVVVKSRTVFGQCGTKRLNCRGIRGKGAFLPAITICNQGLLTGGKFNYLYNEIANSGVSLSGTAQVFGRVHVEIASGGAKLAGSSIISYTQIVTGGARLAGSSVISVISSALPTITSANLVFDLNPVTGSFTNGQAVASLAAANNPSIIATQTTEGLKPTYRVAAGRNLKPCLDFDGADLLNITPVAFRHLFVVAEGDYPTEITNDYASIYVAGNGGDFAQYCNVFGAPGSNPNVEWQTPSGTISRKQNGELVQSQSYWNSAIRPSQINLYDVSKTVDWPTNFTHTLGGMTDQAPNRGWDGRIFRVLAFDVALSTPDRQLVVDYLRAQYQTPQIIFSGDSLTAGTGATSQGTAYPAIVRSAVIRPYSYWVSAIGGIPISTMTTNDVTAIHPQKPHTIVLWGGANNFAVNNQTAAQAKAELDTNVAAHKAAIPGVRILVCTLYTDNQAAAGNSANYRAQAPTFNSLLLADAGYTNGTKADGIVRLDQIPELYDMTIGTYSSDGLHLTDAGYALVGAAVANKINEKDG